MEERDRQLILEKTRLNLRWFRRFWVVCLCVIPLYLLISVAIRDYIFYPRGISGFMSLSPAIYRLVQIVFLVLAVLAYPSLLMLRRIYWKDLAKYASSPQLIMTRFRDGLFILAIICDTVAILGLLLFLFNAELNMVILFGLLALFYYAHIYPAEDLIMPHINRWLSKISSEHKH